MINGQTPGASPPAGLHVETELCLCLGWHGWLCLMGGMGGFASWVAWVALPHGWHGWLCLMGGMGGRILCLLGGMGGMGGRISCIASALRSFYEHEAGRLQIPAVG